MACVHRLVPCARSTLLVVLAKAPADHPPRPLDHHVLQAEAPYSSVYRPAEPLARLVAGNGTAAGAGGSQGVWTLSVVDKNPAAK